MKIKLLGTIFHVWLIGFVSATKGNLNAGANDRPLYNEGLFEGDIVVNGDRNAVVSEHLLWPNGDIFYELSPSIEEIRPNIMKAMEEFESKTCIRFLERNSASQDYVRIEELDGCWSAVGKQGGEQIVSLGVGCHFQGTILHELGHVVGLYHEHSRFDRDDYIKILWNNTQPGAKVQLMKMNPWEHNLLWEKFDYNSIMLYGEDAFSEDDNLPTIRVLQPGVVIGPLWRKEHLSESDVRRINRLYECFGEERPPPPKTPDYVCASEDDCDLQQLSGSLKMERRRLESLSPGTVLVVEAGNSGDGKASFATPFLEVYDHKEGCFSLGYLFPDKSAKSLRIYREDLEDTLEISSLFVETGKIGTWQRIEKIVPLPEFGLRFIIEIESEAEKHGAVIFDNISFSFYSCNSN